MTTGRMFADRRDRVWVPAPGGLRVINEHSGWPRERVWPEQLVHDSYGPLRDVTP